MSNADAPRSTVLVTERLRVTTWRAGDLADLYRLQSDPLAMRHMNCGVENRAQAGARLEGYIREQNDLGWTKWRVEDGAGLAVGRAGFNLSDDGDKREVGYVLTPQVWGLGLATELVMALATWHRDHHQTGLSRHLFAYVFIENYPSRRVLEKAGFRLLEERVHRGRLHAYYRSDP
ncbi:MAG TPA: GNAT family N-acetyltransferase [Candidatus Dormibacteraeota bacterium]